MKIGDEYVPFDSGLNFTDASDREKIRADLLAYLNAKGYYYSSVVVRADGIEVNGTNAPIDRVSTNCEENSAHLRNHYFTRTCDPICEAGLLCWIEQVLPEIIRDFFDTEIFEDYTPACLEPEADPSTCLDCVLCPEQCDLFAEEIYYKQADDNINATSWYAGNISHTKWMTSYSGQAQSYTYDYDAIDRLKTAKSGSYAASQPGWTDHQWGLNTNYDVTIGYADGAGNISSINRAGVTHRDSYGLPIYGGIDNLTLYYDQTKPNQLTSITETTDQEHLTKGFKPYNQSMPESGEILYDANGNMTKNDFKGIKNITYDIYNYPKLIEFNDDVSTIEMDYSADGNKLWMKVSKAGESPKEFSYLDGMVVRLNGEESLYADGGRITDAAGDYRAEYTISDHLGNGRVWFSDLNEDGKVSCDHSEVLQEEHYYPFGMAQEGSWQNDATNPDPLGIPAASEVNDNYTYNGQELEKDLTEWYDYGQRWYDPSLGRFMKPDRYAEKYASFSPYSYGAGNPVKYVDVNGDSLKINGVNYEPNAGYDGDDQFVKDAFTALDYIFNSGADESNVICDITCSETTVNIKENTEKNNPLGSRGPNKHLFDSNTDRRGNKKGDPYVIFDPKYGLEFDKSSSSIKQLFNGGKKGRRSPAEALLHELGHAQSFLLDPKQHAKDSKQPLGVFTNKEEFDVIRTIENPAAARLGGISRNYHGGRPIKVSSPISTQ